MKIKINRLAIVAILVAASLVACGDNDNFDNTDTVSGSTRPNDEEPDTVSGSTRPADGAIAKGRIGTGTFTLNGQTEQNVYGIDFNKDGVLPSPGAPPLFAKRKAEASFRYGRQANFCLKNGRRCAILREHE